MKMLIVDDSKIDRYILERLLKNVQPQVSVVHKENGGQGLQAIREYLESESEAYSFIFLDLSMPVMGGREFLRAYAELKAKTGALANTQVVIVSSSDHPQDKSLVNEFEFVAAYLVKPCQKEALNKVIESL